MRMASVMMQLTCSVCLDKKTNGYHFGVFTCEGCKSFFGRNKHLRLDQIEACRNGGNCVITQKTRALCKYCRFKKCLDVGMSKDRSNYGRRSNLFKYMHFAQNEQNDQQDNQDTREQNYLRVPNVAAVAPRSSISQGSIYEGTMPSARQENRPRSHDSLQAMVPSQLTNDPHRRHNFSSEESSASIQQQSLVLNVPTPSTSRNTSPPSVVSTVHQHPAAALPNFVFPPPEIQLLMSQLFARRPDIYLSQIFLCAQQLALASTVNVYPMSEFIGNEVNPLRDAEDYSNQASLSTPSTETSGVPIDPHINLSCRIVSEPAVAEPRSELIAAEPTSSHLDAIQTEPLNLSVRNKRRVQGQKRKRKASDSEKHNCDKK